MALAYAEQQLDIEIPQHLANIETAYVAPSAPVSSAPVSSIQATSQLLPTDAINEVVNKEDSVSDEQAIAVVDQVSDSAETKNLSENNVAQNDEKSLLIEGLYETVNVINEKVDRLFEITKAPPAVDQPMMASSAQNDIEKTADIAPLSVSNNVPNNNVVAGNSSDANTKLYMARKSFWNGNAKASEKLYLDLVGLDDTDPDIYGELGNVYYAQGKWKQAGKAYYEAAVRLLVLKQDSQVSYLLRVIQGLDMESADKLRHKISG